MIFVHACKSYSAYDRRHRAYGVAVHEVFGADVDYAVLQKLYGPDAGKAMNGAIVLAYAAERVGGARSGTGPQGYSTSYVERMKSKYRMGCAGSRD